MNKNEIGASVDGNTVIITDADKFGKHLDKITEKMKKDYDNVGKEKQEVVLKIMDCKLNPLHLCCLDDEDRPNLKLVEIKNNIASATNGSVLCKIDLSMCSELTPAMLKILDGKYIHMEVYSEMCACDSLEIDDEHIIVNNNGVNKIMEYSQSQGEFFNMSRIVEEIKEAGGESKKIISYNPKFITMIGKIFKTDVLHFSFSKDNAGTFVFPSDGGGMFCVLMPLISDELPNRYFFI